MTTKNNIKLLLVDDEINTQLVNWQVASARVTKNEECESFELVDVRTKSEALEALSNEFDGVVIDVRLGSENGLEIYSEVMNHWRVPIVIHTGNPGDLEEMSFPSHVHVVHKPGETDDILLHFQKIYSTGLTKVFGQRGKIEETMDKVFWTNISPTLNAWQKYVEKGEETETALLRMTINHLQQVLDETESRYFPEEMYICPPATSTVQTGSLVRHKATNSLHVVLTPACDLVIRNGKPKTDRVLICEVNDLDSIVDKIWGETKKVDKKKKMVENLFKNNETEFYYWLPRTEQFEGGVVNFRHLTSLLPTRLNEDFENPKVQIAPQFAKDLVRRFSSNYSRQGQPDFDFSSISSEYYTLREKDKNQSEESS